MVKERQGSFLRDIKVNPKPDKKRKHESVNDGEENNN